MSMKLCVVVGAVLLASLGSSLCVAQQKERSSAQPKTPPADPRASDRAAIRDAFDSFAQAFEARDAKSLAAHFTAEGEFQNVQGLKLQGRAALEHAFAEFFSRTPEVTAEIRPESLRFLSKDSAIDEGAVAVQRGPAAFAATARYNALVVREDGAWRLAQLTESPLDGETSIADLGWLIGQWKSLAGEGVEIQTTYSWEPGQKFIRMSFARKEADLALSGTQMIGLDPATGIIHSWTFEAAGGIGEADWSRDDDHWVLDAAGTLADGRTLTESNILRRVNEDTFTWQSTNRMLDDAELPDLPPVKVTRIKTAP